MMNRPFPRAFCFASKSVLHNNFIRAMFFYFDLWPMDGEAKNICWRR
jgi:hypothetical protein